MGNALHIHLFQHLEHRLDVDLGGSQQGLAQRLAAQLCRGSVQHIGVCVNVKDLAHQRETVGVHTGGRQGKNHITGCHGLVAQDLFLIHNAHGETGQIVLLLRHHARVLGSLAAYQRAVGLHAALSHALDDLCDLLGNVAAAGDVIQEYQRLCTGADDIVHAHSHAVDADGIVLVHDHGNFQLGAHAVGAGDQHRVLVAGAVQLKQATKAAQTANAVLVHGAGHILLHQFNRAITGGDIHTGGCIAFRIAFFHGLTLLIFSRPWDGRSGGVREYRWKAPRPASRHIRR